MDAVNRSNPCAGPFGALYSFYIEREWLSRAVARLAWGADSRPLYRSLSELAAVPEGGVVLDVPCGSGLAMRALDPDRRLRYLAVDLDQRMLDRADRQRRRRSLSQVECLRADAAHLPIADASVDLCFSHGGLHCFARPTEALDEIARCLRPGGRLVGTSFVRPGTRRQRFLFRGERRRTGLPELWTELGLLDHLKGAGLTSIELGVEAGYASFRAAKPVRPGEARR